MRVPAGKVLRVGPGDEVIVRGQLASSLAQLGRLYVFAKEGDDAEGDFSPYVPTYTSVATKEPYMLQPLSLRLVRAQPMREISFTSDIDGFIRVMQEVDTADEPLARVKLKRKICRDLPWTQRVSRRLAGILAWTH